MDRQQESVDLESARGGVRRPRSEAARRPRPQSRFLSALTDSKPSASHPSDGSYREVVDEETVDAEAQEKSPNDRTRESDADVSFSRCISFFQICPQKRLVLKSVCQYAKPLILSPSENRW
jgi:hypothetical protein